MYKFKMWALITKDEKVIARDFKTKFDAMQYRRTRCSNPNNVEPINQNSKRFVNIDIKSRKNV